MRLIDEAFLECPYYGSRQMMRHLHRLGHQVGDGRVVRIMRMMGLRAIYLKPTTSAPHPEHRVYPYLFRELAIVGPHQVWCSDICMRSRRAWLCMPACWDGSATTTRAGRTRRWLEPRPRRFIEPEAGGIIETRESISSPQTCPGDRGHLRLYKMRPSQRQIGSVVIASPACLSRPRPKVLGPRRRINRLLPIVAWWGISHAGRLHVNDARRRRIVNGGRSGIGRDVTILWRRVAGLSVSRLIFIGVACKGASSNSAEA